jgi:glycosyltransferase involved in cell wall biosynthesis
MRLADAIVVPSGYLVDVFAKFGLTARAIHNVIDPDRLRFRERSRLGHVFLTSRLLEPLYNVGCVLRAFALIQERFPDASLTVAADGWKRGELEALSQELGLRNTQFIGRVSFEKMPDLYDAADVYLTATDIDNMPSSILECFAAGLPVVTTDAGGLPYILKHEETGLMVRRGDYKALAACAIRLVEDSHLASKISRQAREDCHKYTWNAVRGEWIGLYRALVAQNHATGSQFITSGERPAKGH